jgi:hypothetical protein
MRGASPAGVAPAATRPAGAHTSRRPSLKGVNHWQSPDGVYTRKNRVGGASALLSADSELAFLVPVDRGGEMLVEIGRGAEKAYLLH